MDMKQMRLLATYGLVAGMFFLPQKSLAGIPDVSNVMVTDVTTRSFSVIWTSSEASSPDLLVYSDAAGTNQVGINVSNPLKCDTTLASVAEDAGVMKVQVTGLDANTTYYFQTVTASQLTSDATDFPADTDPLLQVTTASRTVRANSSNIPFSNDIMLSNWTMADGTTPADGTIVFASVTGGDYPITSYVGDCVSSGNALIDLNNIFDRTTGENFDLSQGVNLNLVNFRGTDGTAQIVHEVPADASLAEIKVPDSGDKVGWNTFASQVMPVSTASRTVFASLINENSLASAWDFNEIAGSWNTFIPSRNDRFNSLKDINPNVGYWLELNADTSLPINGLFSNDPVSLSAGWSMIGVKNLEWMSARDFSNSVSGPGGVISLWSLNQATGSWDTFMPNRNDRFNSLKIVEPGKAYWIEMAVDCGSSLCSL